MAQAATKNAKKQSKLYGVAYSLFTSLAPLSLCLFVSGDVFQDYAVVFWGIMALFTANVIYGFLQLRDRLLFLFLHFGIALFLLSRPFISVVCNEPSWWLLSSPETTLFALTALYLSMACLLGAAVLCGAIHSFNEESRTRARGALGRKLLPAQDHVDEQGKGKRILPRLGASVAKIQDSERLNFIRLAALLCFVLCVFGSFYAGYLKLSYMSGRAYTDFYLVDSSSYTPWVVDLAEAMVPFMLCAYLATMPRRRGAVLCLIAYVATTVPLLMIGSRSNFVIAFLFAALYFVFRAVTDKNEVWVSRRLIVFCCIAAPAGVAAMGIMDYLRAGEGADLSFDALIVDALYKQGVSFTIMGRAYDVNSQIQELGFRFYSLGGIIDTFTQGFLGQTFFGFAQLPTTNSYELATQGWSYAHAMSFFAHDNYLGGEGYGSSYILELFADFGYGGIAVGSFVLGMGLFALSHGLGRNWFVGMCALVAASRVFHMPRGYFDEWISYIWSTRFLLAVAVLIAVSAGLFFLKQHVIEARREKGSLLGKSLRKESVGRAGMGSSAHPLNAYKIAVFGEGRIREVR